MGMQYTYIVHGMGRGGEEEDNFVLQYGKLRNAAKKLLYITSICTIHVHIKQWSSKPDSRFVKYGMAWEGTVVTYGILWEVPAVCIPYMPTRLDQIFNIGVIGKGIPTWYCI